MIKDEPLSPVETAGDTSAGTREENHQNRGVTRSLKGRRQQESAILASRAVGQREEYA